MPPPVDPQRYGPRIAGLLTPWRTMPLGPGRENQAVRDELNRLQTTEFVPPGRKLANEPMAQACLAGLWLYHDFLDQSHRISQDLGDTSGSYWHGIMHRREPDPGNAKYWFRRVGDHPVFAPLHEAAKKVVAEHPPLTQTEFLARQRDWDPFAWIDLCEQARRQEVAGEESELVSLCREIGLIEWQLLFDHGWQLATC